MISLVLNNQTMRAHQVCKQSLTQANPHQCDLRLLIHNDPYGEIFPGEIFPSADS